jgi:hypothetical protein
MCSATAISLVELLLYYLLFENLRQGGIIISSSGDLKTDKTGMLRHDGFVIVQAVCYIFYYFKSIS